MLNSQQSNANGQWLTQSYANGLTQSKSYDLQGRLTNHSAGTSYQRGYQYDANGNRTQLNDNGRQTTYYYQAYTNRKVDFCPTINE